MRKCKEVKGEQLKDEAQKLQFEALLLRPHARKCCMEELGAGRERTACKMFMFPVAIIGSYSSEGASGKAINKHPMDEA